MEAHGVREFPPESARGRFVRRALQAAVIDVILPAFAEQVVELATAGRPLTRDLAARATVYLQARTHYGIVDPADLDGLRELWRAVLGDQDLRALDDLYARVVWIPDGELERLDDAAREYRRIVGEPDEPPEPGWWPPTGRVRRRRGSRRFRLRATAASAEDGAGRGVARRRARAGDRERPLRSARATRRGRRPRAGAPGRGRAWRAGPASSGRGGGTGLPTGRMPDRGVDRPPYPDEVQHARRYANRLRQAITHGTRQIDKRTPGGRFDGRAYARGRAAAGRRPARHHPPVAGHPAGAGADPGAARRADHRHLRVDGRLRVRARTDRLDPHRRPAPDRRPLRHRPVRQQRRAARRRTPPAAARARHPHRRRHRVRRRGDRARLRPARDDQPAPPPVRLRPLRRRLGRHPRRRASGSGRSPSWASRRSTSSIGIAPLSVECDRITVITDPAQALDHIAADTVAALRARRR